MINSGYQIDEDPELKKFYKMWRSTPPSKEIWVRVRFWEDEPTRAVLPKVPK